MRKFPDPVPLDASILQSRNHRKDRLFFAARWGVLIRLAIVCAELVGFFVFGSRALLMDAVASSMDIISTLFLMLAFFFASRPPDEDHPFGHGRYEPLAGMLLGLLLTVVGVWSFFDQIWKVAEEGVETLHPFVWVIPFLAVILLEICYRIACFVAKRENSPALLADAVHYRIDALTSVIAMAALLVASVEPRVSGWFDTLGALVIAAMMVGLGVMAARKNVQQLMDKAPKSDYFERVKKAAEGVSGVLGTEKLKIQLYGPDAHVDIDVEVAPNLSVEEAHRISQFVRAEIQKAWPQVRDVTVHIEPYYPGDH